MIHKTEESGAARGAAIDERACELEGLGSAGAAGASTPARCPGLRQHPVATPTGRSPGRYDAMASPFVACSKLCVVAHCRNGGALMAKVTKRLRFEILRRDNHACRYCGATAAEAKLVVDHVIPQALGGPTTPDNLATACEPCNSGKSSVPPEAPIVEQVADDALRWSVAMERAAADMEARLRERDDQNAVFLNEWTAYTYGGSAEQVFPLDPSWKASVTRLRIAGLTDPLIVEAVNATMGAGKVLPENRFRYFCGVAWNMVTQMQEAAEKIAAEQPSDDETLFPERSRDEVAATLDLFRAVTEHLLGWLPPEIRKLADADTQYQAEATETVDAPYEERLAMFLLFAAMILKDCQFQASEFQPPKRRPTGATNSLD